MDVESLVQSYNDGLQQVLNQHAPLVTRCIRDRPSAPWLTSEVRDARRKRRRAERLWRTTKLTIHNMRNEVTKCAIAAKRLYFTSKIDSAVFSTKQLFKVSNELLRKSGTSILPTNIPSNELPQQFCQFFTDKIKKLREELDSHQCEPPSFAVYEGPGFDHFSIVSEDEISKLIKNMPTKSCILDPLPTNLVKHCIDDLVPLITHINESLMSGTVPVQLNRPLLFPSLRNMGLTATLSRTLDQFPTFPLCLSSKVLEKVVLSQLQEHLYENNLFVVKQSAYRKGHSVETVVLSVLNGLLTDADDKQVSLTALLALRSIRWTIPSFSSDWR